MILERPCILLTRLYYTNERSLEGSIECLFDRLIERSSELLFDRSIDR